MENKKITIKVICGILLAIVISLGMSAYFHTVMAQNNSSESVEGFKQFSNGVITILIPANGEKPMFIWWYNNKSDTAYVFKYSGLSEIWTVNNTPFNHKLIFENENDFKEYVKEILTNVTGISIEDILNQVKDKLQNLLSIQLVYSNGSINKENVNELINNLENISATLNKLPSVFSDNITTIINQLIEQIKTLGNVTEISKIMRILNQINTGLRSMITTISDVLTRIDSALNYLSAILNHPFYFPFDAANWSLIGPKNITDNSGKTIGIQFIFNLTNVYDKRFSFAAGNIMISNELFFLTVSYKSGNQTFNVTKAELKSDIIIKKWNWNIVSLLGNVKNNTPIISYFLNELKNVRPALVLISHFTNPVVNSNKTQEFNELEMPGGEDEVENENATVISNQTSKFNLGNMMLNDEEVANQNVYNEDLPVILIKASNSTIAGFFRFVPFAKVTYPNGTKSTVNVSGYFILEGRHVSIFLVYPYFDNGTLIHDPMIGVAGASISTQPNYVVSISTNGEVTTQQTTMQVAQINWLYYVVAGIIAVAVIALFLVTLRRIKK